MAGDWIKMRTALGRHPKVIAMARSLAGQRSFMSWLTNPVGCRCRQSALEHVTIDVVTRVTVGALLDVWGAANLCGESEGMDRILPRSDLATLDSMCGVPGFGRAMASVGWAVANRADESVTLPNFLAYNTPEDERPRPKSDAERAREYRERKKAGTAADPKEAASRNVTEITARHGRLDKRRVNTPQPPRPKPAADRGAFSEFYDAYPKHAKPRKAREAWERAVKRGADSAVIIAAAREYAMSSHVRTTPARFIPAPSAWLDAESWSEDRTLWATPRNGTAPPAKPPPSPPSDIELGAARVAIRDPGFCAAQLSAFRQRLRHTGRVGEAQADDAALVETPGFIESVVRSLRGRRPTVPP